MLNGINLIRALACSSIAIFHICEHVNSNFTGVRVTFNLAGPGFHLFLMISGFILVFTTKPHDHPARFMAKRVFRIAPIYWVATFLVIGLASARHWLFPEADLSIGSILSSLFFLPHADLAGRAMPILFVGWTLNYMMLFYALFAASLLTPARWQPFIAAGGLLAVMALAPFAPNPGVAAFYSDPILIEFAVGCLLGVFLRQPGVISWIKTNQVWPLALLGGAGLIAAMLIDAHGFLEVALYSPASALLIFAAVGQDLHRKPLSSGVLAHLGLISYAVYLVHPLLIPTFGIAIRELVDDGPLGAALVFLVVAPLTYALADLAYRFIEKPANAWLRKTFISTAQGPRTPQLAQMGASPGVRSTRP